jgi:hypothetical protein
LEKKIGKNKVSDKGKLSVVFDTAMSNMYKNNIFPTLPCGIVEIHDLSILNIGFSIKCKIFAFNEVFETNLFYVLKYFPYYFSLIFSKVY